MKTKKEIIREVFRFYTSDPSRRSIMGGEEVEARCMYLSDNGNKCGFSHFCTEEGVRILHDFEVKNGPTGILCICNDKGMDVDSFLKKEYQGHDAYFWSHIQGFHDSVFNWEEGIEGIRRRRGWLRDSYTNYGCK